jgi:hypothetical protein
MAFLVKHDYLTALLAALACVSARIKEFAAAIGSMRH